jgi:hypothetical protein
MKPKDYIKAMTTGRWPPKPEEEMISPGTERAIMRLAELTPALTKALESLAKSAERIANPLVSANKDEVALTIALTPDEWCEVVNAVSVRSVQLNQKEQLDLEDMNPEQVVEWVATLDRAYDKITAVLTENHLTY